MSGLFWPHLDRQQKNNAKYGGFSLLSKEVWAWDLCPVRYFQFILQLLNLTLLLFILSL